jgi:hypothetical protein
MKARSALAETEQNKNTNKKETASNPPILKATTPTLNVFFKLV